jgi:hypothetical protein
MYTFDQIFCFLLSFNCGVNLRRKVTENVYNGINFLRDLQQWLCRHWPSAPPPPLQFHYDLGTVLAVMAALGYLSMWLTELEIFFSCNCVHYNNVAVWSFIIRTLYQILLGWSIQWGLYSQGMQYTQGDEECTLNFSWKPWKERITKEV